MTIKQSGYIYGLLLYLCCSSLLLHADECTDNQCNYNLYFDKAGYYVANVSLSEDGQAGMWGLSMLISDSEGGQSISLDNLNTGSSTSATNNLPSWIAFYLAESQSIDLTAYNYLNPEQSVLATFLQNADNGRTAFLEPTAIDPQQVFGMPQVDAGFYIIEITSTDKQDIYSGLAIKGEKMSNILNGGWVEPTNTPEGFISFYLSAPSTVRLSLSFADNYSTLGASQPQLDIEAIDSETGEREIQWKMFDGIAKPIISDVSELSDLEIVQQIMRLNNRKLDEISLDKVAYRSAGTPSRPDSFVNGYTLDDAGNVIGLNINRYSLGGKEISWSDLSPLVLSLKHLVKLGLYYRGIGQLSPEFFSQLKLLQVVDLAANGLTELPAEIAQLENLTKLDISRNQLTSLPPEFGQLKHLSSLNVSQNSLQTLPSEISQLQSLTELDISVNQFSVFPTELSPLQNLASLDISRNQLRTLPSEIGDLTGLITLSLPYNQLQTLPSEIGNLTSLATLSISFNQLQTLPSDIGGLASLTTLLLSYNQLQTLPPEIGDLQALETLYLHGNQLQNLPVEIGLLKNSTQLSIYNNVLVTPPQEVAEQGIEAIQDYFAAQ
ncbi:leucine-rich repeat domain-containing protein [Candidatus Albibeggiatoa sp. nov. NOAA]|uniref:leucine-rich repeat domain-containing protein n=1 Tax=Candidatus Albibeggiatoa sp. nov. NOAA TaxID=3162724 RepID=UPI0032F9163F|nr:leucine-rich repeat domain-containing protein [Thiotrichaceae bacterium]